MTFTPDQIQFLLRLVIELLNTTMIRTKDSHKANQHSRALKHLQEAENILQEGQEIPAFLRRQAF